MKKILIIILGILLFLPNVNADDFYSLDSKFKPTSWGVIYTSYNTDISTIALIVNDTCLNILSGDLRGLRCLNYTSESIKYICRINEHCPTGYYCDIDDLVCIEIEPELAPSRCPFPESPVLIFIILTGIALFFMIYASVIKSGLMLMLASVMAMVVSWTASGCSVLFGTAFGIISLVVFILSVLIWQKD